MREQADDRKVAILGFHKIGEPPPGWWSWFYIPEPTYAGYLRHLHESGWQVIDLATFLAGLVAPDTLPQRAALLTFDDGYRSMRDAALTWLRHFEFPAVLFVPTDFVGGRNPNDPLEPMCDWDDLRELHRHGVAIQSHGKSHRRLSELTPAEQEGEFRHSKATLEAGLGTPVEVFAYPYGDGGADPRAVDCALEQAGYRAACLYEGGPHPVPIVNPYRLFRLAMGPDTDLPAALGEAAPDQ